uniref:Uncharacterized protein n=1 Tax=Arundo donax TaxID=35708 RepID=A0A0A9B6D5_ARUDO
MCLQIEHGQLLAYTNSMVVICTCLLCLTTRARTK